MYIEGFACVCVRVFARMSCLRETVMVSVVVETSQAGPEAGRGGGQRV